MGSRHQAPPVSVASPAPKALHPLSSKVSAVLSTSYADAEFRDGLNLLDERSIQNKGETRRRLRLDLQKEVIECNGDIIHEFGRVADQLQRIGLTIDSLNKVYSEMKTKIDLAHTSTSSVLVEASSLMLQRRQAEAKQQLFKSLQTQFVLSDNEVACLTIATEPVDDRFFTALSKAKQIVKDCEILLGFEDQTLGHDIMEKTSKTLDQAFQKLYKWIQREFRALNLENPQFGARIRGALRVLAERPTLFHNCLDFFAEAREQLLSDSFFVALTGSTPSGTEEPSVKPIELAAHDPLRYVGDMLAWTHSAAVSEREALEVLFVSEGDEIAKGMQAGRDHEIWRLVESQEVDAPAFDAVKALNDLVDRNVSGVARILRQRVEQVIQTNEDTILAYKLANLLNFYRVMFKKLLGDQSVLIESLAGLESEALRQFRALTRDYIAALQGEFQHAPADLGSPDFLQEALEQLHAILKTYDTSLTSSASRETDFLPILGEALDPFIQGCHNMAKDIGPPGTSIFLINCLLAAKAVLHPFDFTESRVESLQETIDLESETLAKSQYRFFREDSGLDSILSQVSGITTTSKEDLSKLGTTEALAPETMAKAGQSLDDFLPSALMDALEKVKQLQDSSLARRITEDAAERFCEDFEHLEEVLIAADQLKEEDAARPGLEDEQPMMWRSLFPRTSGEIRVLLS